MQGSFGPSQRISRAPRVQVLADDDAADAASDADTRDPLLGAAATDEGAVTVARAVDARARITRIFTNTTEATTQMRR